LKKDAPFSPLKTKTLSTKDSGKELVDDKQPKPFPIVAFGASAGGIKAFTTVLKHLDPNLGMAYVLVMHLSPNHKSALAEIMRSKTTMPVHTVEDGMELKPDNVFVIPPNTFMGVVDGHLKLAPRSLFNLGNFVVDYFLTGLAGIYKNNAIGVILSGTANDGTLGLKAIKAEGGITFAQDATAEFKGMPQSAFDSGYVDFKLPPEKIARELKRLTKIPYTNLTSDKIDVVSIKEINNQAEDLKQILALVKNRSGVDFYHHYKKASIYRRVMRRMVLSQFDKLKDYGKMLKTNQGEIDALFDDFLINVTNFFRDPDFYKTLTNEIFPGIVSQNKPNGPIRIWVAGCSTGEEAYSIAICLNEFLTNNRVTAVVQIFASDLDANAIEKARMAIYPVSALHGVSPKYLEQYFKKVDSHYQVIKSIRENCVFSNHNLLKDPPFSRLDLVSCQNVLIYLETSPQKRILQTFHYALKASGYMFLSKSENIGSSGANLFESLDKKIRYYSKKAAQSTPLEFAVHMPGKTPEGSGSKPSSVVEVDVEKDMGKLMLSRFVYPGIVVDKNLTITQFFGETSPYLSPATGRASFNVLNMIREDLVIDLRMLLQEARKTERTAVREGIKIYNKRMASEITLEIVPKKTAAGTFFLVVFKGSAPMKQLPVAGKPGGSKARTILKLEAELVQSLEVIRTTTEEYETTYEELQANNEEILSSNEELQSVNEELETSKEELQSSNEELTTMNDELNKRNVELKESYDYTDAIMENMHGPLLVLTSDLRVRKANKVFYQTFRMHPAKTEGNFLYDLDDGVWNIPALCENLKNIKFEDVTFKTFEFKHIFKDVGERDLTVNMYRLVKGDTEKETLILLAFDDFTRRFQAESSLRLSQEQLKLSLVGDSIGTWHWNLKTNEIKWSKENEHLNGLEEGSFGENYQDWLALIHAEDVQGHKDSVAQSIKNLPNQSNGSHSLELEYRIKWPDGGIHWILSKGQIYFDHRQQADRIVGVSMDITERKAISEYMAQQVALRTAQLTQSNEALIIANNQLEQFVFISSHDLQEPLRKIQTFTNLLLDDESVVNLNPQKYLAKINQSAARMSALLHELHSYSMLKNDPSKFVMVDLNDTFKAILTDFELKIVRKNAVIHVPFMPTILADPTQISQLFNHLLGNALKFNRGAPVIEWTCPDVTELDYATHPELRKDTHYISVGIRDNGIGFDQKYANKLFVLFQQLKDLPSNGTGIGLAICKKVADHHGGFIVAEGRVDEGATFRVFLPDGKQGGR
jgi:two-component system, chemotaxis family, CheB/CheR fusion protein